MWGWRYIECDSKKTAEELEFQTDPWGLEDGCERARSDPSTGDDGNVSDPSTDDDSTVDTDGNGLNDGKEVELGTGPTDTDLDDDG